MKKVSKLILVCAILLVSCSPSAPPLSSLPDTIATTDPTITIEPTQTTTPTSIPYLEIRAEPYITINAASSVPSSKNLMDIWTVGNDGLIFYKTPQTHPSRVDSPERVDLHDVDFTWPDNGWIVGEGTLILHWDGKQWEVSNPSTPGGVYSYTLNSVAFTQENDGWAAGCVNSEGGEQILIYHWDGLKWSRVSLPEELYFWVCIHDIAGLSPTDIWMVGTGWDAGKESGVALHWDGDRWESYFEGDSFAIQSISALSSDDIWATTKANDLAYTYSVWHWDGKKWSEKASLESANIIYARQPDDVFAVGDKVWHWDGDHWTDISLNSNLPVDTNLVDIIEFSYPEIWLFDSSGVRYSFYFEK